MDSKSDFIILDDRASQEILSLASLFEGDFSIDWIVDLTQRKASEILRVLESSLRERGVIQKEPGILCFRNMEMRNKLQNRFSPEEKENWHARIADYLIKEIPDRDQKPLILTSHLHELSNDVEKCRWLNKGGDAYRKVYKAEDALKCYTKVLYDLASSTEETADEIYIQAAISYSKVATARHDTTQVLAALQESLFRATKRGRRNDIALIKLHIAKNEWLRSRYISAIKYYKQGWSLANDLQDPKVLRSAAIFRTFFLFWLGRFEEAVRTYEKTISDIPKFPKGQFPLLAALTVGYCYAQIGQVTQGLGMIDAIRTHCQERGDKYMAAQAGFTLGLTMLDTSQIQEAIPILERAVEEGAQVHNEWARIMGKLMLSYAHYLMKENKAALHYLRDFIGGSKQVQVTVQAYPQLIHLYWGMEEGKILRFPEISVKEEIQRLTRGGNVSLKGIAYRYRALIQRKEGVSPKTVLETLAISLSYLKESGHQIEWARTNLEIGRQYLSMGEEEKGHEAILQGSKVLFPLNEALFPDDLRILIKESSPGRNFMGEILKLGQEVATLRDSRELFQNIISAVNRLTGAERGALFLLERTPHRPHLQLRASRNITAEEVDHSDFSAPLKVITEVARTGRGQIFKMGGNSDSLSPRRSIIRSCICVPLCLRDKIIGVLYHDNRLLSSVFKPSDLEILTYFAAQAAIGLDNARAYEEIQQLNQKLKNEKIYYEEQHLHRFHFDDIVGESQAMMEVLRKIEQVAKTDATVLILGETGVGKELVAQAIHRYSRRSNKSFIRAFCSALPESLIPSELFGHEKGAFTGATHRRVGRFELADGGTLFLDEIGDLPLEVQVRFLRVLQNKEFERVGGNETLRSDFRLLVATNRSLEQEVKTGKFRTDLYYRLNVFPIFVPPLRERREDIPLLTQYFLKNYSIKMGKTFAGISKSEIDKLVNYDWPGNVRELENIIERAVILSPGPDFYIPELNPGQLTQPPAANDSITLEENERQHILKVLKKARWKVRGPGGAAELLNINFSTLNFRMKKLGIERPPDFSRKK